MRIKHKINIFFVLVIALNNSSCKKLISIDEPKTQIISEKVFESDQSALGAFANMYAQLNNGVSINGNLTPFLGLYTDELTTNSLTASNLEFASSSLTTSNANNLNIWKGFYSVIYQANAALEGLATSKGVTPPVNNQLTGEARFLRAFCYFYLLNLYGNVPLLTNTNVYENSVASRNSVQQVYQQILTDLNEAKSLLKETYPSPDKARANYWSIVALIARVKLYQSDWAAAEAEATSLIASGKYPLETVANVFNKASTETILQAWTPNGYTSQGSVLNPASGTPTYFMTQSQVNAFEPGDGRKSAWTRMVTVAGNNYTLSAKYKKAATTTGSDAQYLLILRSAEQYLIRAEARTQQNNIAGAVADINAIRNRAGLASILFPVTKDSCLTLIESEKRKEFFTEWANRFTDLKRWNKLETEMTQYKSTWTSKALNLPIPQNEINKNPYLEQNPGY
jgi:starch-binding outer membrane protein, SusD/RagB family